MNTRLMTLMLIAIVSLLSCQNQTGEKTASVKESVERPAYAIVIHGGAGTILKKNLTPEKEAGIKEALNAALDVGEKILADGGSALDAVERTIHVLENSAHFNAGHGAVFTHEGKNELDASIMRGDDQNAGAVGGLRTVKNPISAARAVMEQSEHVLLTSNGAEEFARAVGLETVDPKYFYTDARWQSLQRAIKRDKGAQLSEEDDDPDDRKHGTVGCVALDKDGLIVAGTSTGGMTNKRYNRFGDVPIIGAGTYANNATAGVSCTGHGEYFIRYAVAHDLHARMHYLDESVGQAADHIINTHLVEKGGGGGLIAIDKDGNVSMEFNTPGMYRGYAKPGERVIGMYKE